MKQRSSFLLVIAIDKYNSPIWPDLNNAVKDALELKDIFIDRYGFELLDELLLNEKATREEISQMFANALTQLMPDDNLIVYFAGHGFMNPMTLKGFWVPHEAGLTPIEMISNSEIKDFIEVLPAEHVLLIADACFSGTFITQNRGRMDRISYHQLDSKKSRWVITSGQEEKVSDGVAGANSPFAQNLKKFLLENTNEFASVAELVRYVCTITGKSHNQKPQGAPISNVGHDQGQLILQLNEKYVKTKVTESDGNPVTSSLRSELRAYFNENNHYAGGKEILLVDLTGDPNILVIAENFRFDDDGNKKLIFEDGKVLMGEHALPMYARASTWVGMTRYMEENMELYSKYRITIMHAHESIEGVETTEPAIFQQELIIDLMDQNREPRICLHCGRTISTSDSYSVEIDERGLKPAAGNVHRECLRSIDRIIGRIIFGDAPTTSIVNVDYEKWLELLRTGQGFIQGAIRVAKGHTSAIISWNRTHLHPIGDYCIRFELADGSIEYLKTGKDIHRFTANEIDAEVATMNRELGDFGKLSTAKLFGDVDYLESVKNPEEEILKVKTCTKVKYTKQLEASNSRLLNDFAPLGLLQTLDGEIVKFGNIVPLLTSPSQFDDLYKNWKDSGWVDGSYTIHIIENDKEVDFYFIGFFDDGFTLVLDPMFAGKQNLVSGVRIVDIRQIIK